MQKVWLKSYPQQVPQDINVKRFSNVYAAFRSAVSEHGSRPAFANMGFELSFKEVDDLSRDFAAYLHHDLGLRKGDRIALQMPNLLQYPIALFGALRAGLVVVNTNPLYTPREMRHQFADSGAKAIVILSNFAHHLEEIIKETAIEHVIITDIGDMIPMPKRWLVNFVVRRVKKMVPSYDLPNAIPFRQALALGSNHQFDQIECAQSDIAFLQYTGGTTGVSKGAILTHQNVLANMEQIAAWMLPRLQPGQEIAIAPLPLYHIFCLTVNCLALAQYGCLNVLITNPKDLPGLIKEMRRWRFTVFTGVNTLYNALLNHPDFANVDFSHLKISVAGGMALQTSVALKWKEVTKTTLVEGYGLTEASPVVCCNPIDGSDVVGTIGLPLPSTDIQILDDDEKELPLGQAGELCVKGPQVMDGYYQKPEETSKVFTRDGWLKTGDVAFVDERGYVKIVDRKKDMILVSGFNVYPNEVEEVIAKHPKVLEVAAIGVTDEHSGEAVKVFIVKKDMSLTAKEIETYCLEYLVNYKRPKHIEFRGELPKTNVGKILRRALRD